MKIFISSRINELWLERNTAIETVHFAGHTPIYIETEPISKDYEAKNRMDSLINKSEALISIFYLSSGKIEKLILNNHTPIQYEYTQFRTIHKNGKVFIYRKAADKYYSSSQSMIDWFEQVADESGTKIQMFEKPEELATLIFKDVKELQLDTDVADKYDRIIIRYSGPDFIGLIENVSETIFSSFGFNIDYISHAARGGLATLYISCSSRGLPIELGLLEYSIKNRLNSAIKLAAQNLLFMNGTDLEAPINISVNIDNTKLPDFQFYLELRTIDAPGQLNAVCKVIKTHHFNIDDLQLMPTEKEYKRQTTMRLWISRKDVYSPDECEEELLKLESIIKTLVGVRSFSIKVVDCRCS